MTKIFNQQNKTLGFLGENIAARYLRAKNYQIIAQNYQKPWGEIDIIAEKDKVIVFCEVKTNSRNLGNEFAPEWRVNSTKARHILRTARLFLNSQYPQEEKEWRIDVIAIVLNRLGQKAKIKHFKNALFDKG